MPRRPIDGKKCGRIVSLILSSRGGKNVVDGEETDGVIEQAIIEPANPPISIKPWGRRRRHKYQSCPPKLSSSQPTTELSIKSGIHKLTPSVTLAKQPESRPASSVAPDGLRRCGWD